MQHAAAAASTANGCGSQQHRQHRQHYVCQMQQQKKTVKETKSTCESTTCKYPNPMQHAAHATRLALCYMQLGQWRKKISPNAKNFARRFSFCKLLNYFPSFAFPCNFQRRPMMLLHITQITWSGPCEWPARRRNKWEEGGSNSRPRFEYVFRVNFR